MFLNLIGYKFKILTVQEYIDAKNIYNGKR